MARVREIFSDLRRGLFIALGTLTFAFGPISNGYAAAFIGFGSYATTEDILDDGTTIIGGVRFSISGTRISLGSTAQFGSGVSDLSEDGRVAVGWNLNNQSLGYRWAEESGTTILQPLPKPPTSIGWENSSAAAISADGSIVVGESWGSAALWRQTEDVINLGRGAALDVSDDGMRVVGHDNAGAGWLWTEETGRILLQGMSRAEAISSDGSIVVGSQSLGPGLSVATRWTEETGSVSLGSFVNQSYGYATDVSDDGTRIVGVAQNDSFGFGIRATIWSPDSGLQDLKNVLAASGLDLQGWVLFAAWGISDNGRFVIGYGQHYGQYESFLAELPEAIPQVPQPFYPVPEPSTAGLVLAGGVLLIRWRSRAC